MRYSWGKVRARVVVRVVRVTVRINTNHKP